MPSSDHRTSRRRANPPGRRRKTPGARSNNLVQRNARDESTLLERILNTPHLARVIPRLQPEVLHRVIQACGLEDSAELLALATPIQLERVFDLDLWRAARPGSNDELDAERFGKWLEVLLELGEAAAAEKLASMDPEIMIAALAQHIRVFDLATRGEPSDLEDEAEGSGSRSNFLSSEIGGYLIEARRSDAWHAIVNLLPTLDADHPGYFHPLMRGCIRQSNSGWELDGLDDLLSDPDQDMFDLAAEREERREKQGYVAAEAARAFLQSARQLRLTDAAPPVSPLARAYFRDIDRTPETSAETSESFAPSSPTTASDPEIADALTAIVELIGATSEPTRQARALLPGEANTHATLAQFHRHMQFVCDADGGAYAARTEEFGYLANAMLAGASIQGRGFTPREASDAATAVCNLGIQHWPADWSAEPAHRSASMALGTQPDDFLVDHDLITVFQVGYRVLYAQVTMRAAERLIELLSDFRHSDPETQAGLDDLRVVITREWRAGTPWRARDALDVLLVLDQPAWASMGGLVSECPVMHASLSAARLRTRTVDAAAFEFISERKQIAAVHEFLQSLPQLLFG
jgi:Family of unknown function (DUF6178)